MIEAVTPLLKQYNQIKSQHPDYLLFFRLGDFYEMFNEDAKTASRILGLTLTKKHAGDGKTIPLAGFPYHSVASYLAKLIHAGQKVAICEQTEDPKHAKGIVKREVIRIVTPGTLIESDILNDKENNYLIAIVKQKKEWGLAKVDLSTGSFAITEFKSHNAYNDLISEINRIQPAEILVVDKEDFDKETDVSILKKITISNTNLSPNSARQELLDHLQVQSLEGFGCQNADVGITAAGVVLAYLKETQKSVLSHINRISQYRISDFMFLDYTTQRSLELISGLHHNEKQGTLLGVLDHTITSMGARLLRQWILQPLKNKDEIEERFGACGTIYNNLTLREKLLQSLKGIYDLERIIARINCRAANPKDLLSLRLSLEKLPELKEAVLSSQSTLLEKIGNAINPLPELTEKLKNAISDNPPYLTKDGGIFHDGYNPELDELRLITRDSKKWLNNFQQKEIQRTGINLLKIGFNRVFGYYIEITKSNLGNVPEGYIRKQTLANAERYITPELKEKEDQILNADEKMKELEYNLFEGLREEISQFTREIQTIAHCTANLDCILSFAQAAIVGNYTQPIINEENKIEIIDGRHPVIEAIDMDQPFVPNDTTLDNEGNQILLITGPNMAGKSTYIRQVALITLMAHIGSFVPAKKASICIVDRIFTRVGAMDYLIKGQSTFLVEMSETANILNNATDKGLVILDEIGRGTSTYDGLSIAWAVIEYLHNKKHCMPKTLFATHYHELADLENALPRVKNYNVAVLEEEDKIVFLYKIIKGSTDHSYGIYAAKLAGIPDDAIRRAREILFDLECGNTVHIKATGMHEKETDKKKDLSEYKIQLSLFDGITHPALEQLRKINIETITPIQALNILAELITKVK